MKEYYVYCIYVDKVPVYIGKGRGSRMHHHLRNFILHNTAVNKVLKDKLNSAANKNQIIDVKTVRENLSNEEALHEESNLISLYGRKIYNEGTLCNVTEGGNQPPSVDNIKQLLGADKFFEIKKKQINSMLATTDKKIQRVAPFIRESLKNDRMLKDIASDLDVTCPTLRSWIQRLNLTMNYQGKDKKIKEHLRKYRAINKHIPNSNAKLYTIQEPGGKIISTRFLKQYCTSKNIDYSNLRSAFKRKSQHKGYSIINQQEPEDLQ
jgi:hypothetical protein